MADKHVNRAESWQCLLTALVHDHVKLERVNARSTIRLKLP